MQDGLQEPPVEGHADLLLDSMKRAGVDGALIVQPGLHSFDHSYVTSTLNAHPDKFVGCLLANPAATGEGVNQMNKLVLEDGYQAVRFNPYLWPDEEKMTNKVAHYTLGLEN